MTQTIKLSKEELNKEYFVRGLVPEWDTKIKSLQKLVSTKEKKQKYMRIFPMAKTQDKFST